MHPATSKANQNKTVSAPARLIRACVSTLEYPIIGLIAACVVVECVILLTTQQYEAATAPVGSVLVLGMSAGGMVVFFAELLKLPVAWASGALTGWTRIIFNLVAALLCLLTATTVKDIVTREWDMALAPSRMMAATARETRAEIEALQQTQVQLAQNTKDAEVFWNARIVATNAELEALEAKKTTAQTRYIERLNVLTMQAMDPLVREKVAAIQKRQNDEAAIAVSNLRDLNEQLVALHERILEEEIGRNGVFAGLVATAIEERTRTQEQNESDARRAAEEFATDTAQFNTASEAYGRAKTEHAASHEKVNAALQVKLASIRENDHAFADAAKQEGEAREAADKEKLRLDDLLKKAPVPQPPARRTVIPSPLPEIPTPSDSSRESGIDGRIVTMNTRIETAKADRDRVQGECAAEVKKLLDAALETSGASKAESAKRRSALETDFTEFNKQLDGEMSVLLSRRAEQETQRTQLLDPIEVQRKLQEIPEQIKKLNGEAENAESEAKRLRTDTNAIRAASGPVRWLIPDADENRLEEIAYGVYPGGIAILVSFLPALLLELGVHSLIAPPATRERSQWNLIHHFSRHRRALIRERGIAAAKLRRAEQEQATYENARAQCERDAEALKTKTEEDSTARIDLQKQQRIAFETEVCLRTEALDQEIEARATALHQELVAARDQAILERDEARNASSAQVAELLTQKAQAVDLVTALTDTLLKQNADIELLSRRVIQLDARGPISPTLVE